MRRSGVSEYAFAHLDDDDPDPSADQRDVWASGTLRTPGGYSVYVATNTALAAYSAIEADGSLTLNHSIDPGTQDVQSVWGDGTYLYAGGLEGISSVSVDASEILTLIDTIWPDDEDAGAIIAIWGDGTYIYAGTDAGEIFTLSVDGSGIDDCACAQP